MGNNFWETIQVHLLTNLEIQAKIKEVTLTDSILEGTSLMGDCGWTEFDEWRVHK